jgi:hypothetical protein
MKHRPFHSALALTVGFASVLPNLPAADPKPAPREERKEIRVITAPVGERRVFPREGERRERPEMERATFLGVEVTLVPPALSAQLGLDHGTGLVVAGVAPKSPAAGILQQHDVLLQLDDQILIESRQLSVLVRNHKEGDEVSLTYLRGGKKATAKVKLGVHEVPKFSWHEGQGGGSMPAIIGIGRGEGPGGEPENRQRAEVDRLLGMLRRPGQGDPVRIEIDRREGPGVRAMSINTANSNLVFNDDQGALELSSKDGRKSLVAKDASGREVFSGPVSTPEERKALPPELRERLERLEGMREMTFKTDGDFQGAEVRVMRPAGRSISVPPAPPTPSRRPGVL